MMLLLAGAPPAQARATEEPFELVRSLRVLQDRIASSGNDALLAHRQAMPAISAQLAAVEPERWREPRNARAAVLYILSGGEPRILEALRDPGRMPEPAGKLLRGALAYAEGRDREAGALLADVDARSLDPGIAGAIALVQGALAANAADAKKAIALLDDARLLSPGTLVEETALRRQMLLLPAAGRWDRLAPLLGRYIRRFRKSSFASSFWRQLAAEIAGREPAGGSDRLARLEAALEGLEVEERRDLHLSMAREGIARGKVELTRFAVEIAMRAADRGSAAAQRAQVYDAAALIITGEVDRGLSLLDAVEREKLTAPDAGLLDAARSAARQIRRLPETTAGSTSPLPPGAAGERARELSGIGLNVIGRAHTAMAGVDALLSGGAR